MVRRRTLLGALVGILLLGFVAPPVFGDSLTVYRLEPSSGWVELPPVNPYAAAMGEAPLQGWSNAGSVSWPVRATATFEPDTQRAELSVQFIPVSGDIRTNATNLFIAPLGRRLEWRMVVTVRNPNDIPMRDVKVRDEFGRAFRASLAGKSAGEARIEGDDPAARLPLCPTFVWDVGDLGPGEAARAEASVVTTRDRDGNMQFSRPGIYSIDTGARLTYTLAGKKQVRNAGCGSVIARKDMGALRSEGPPFDVDADPIAGGGTGAGSVVPVLPPIVGDGPDVRAVITRVAQEAQDVGTRDISPWTPMFYLVAAGETPNISEDGGKFVVPPGEYAEWKVTVTIANPWNLPGWDHWDMNLYFGAELSVEEISRTDPVTGDTFSITRASPTDPVHVSWQWSGDPSEFPPGSQAVVELKVYTAGYAALGEYEFVRSATLGWTWPPHGSGGAWLGSISVVASPTADVSLSSTRQDWRVRKPGTYAALATEMSFTGVGKLTVDFSGFTNLAQQDGGPDFIRAWYGFGNDLAAVETSGWISANDLNLDANSRGPITLDPSTPVTLRMWSKIDVGEEDMSSEYEDVGVVTFIVSNN
ncbi:MAG: hypothetical protein NUW12_04345 [Firmicutes bacterium]|jgi:hypothetical protein|nr:hypothetical protein [Bacillota bacterium]MDH7495177.1 hypothetical protein [Bacillota bacterium]